MRVPSGRRFPFKTQSASAWPVMIRNKKHENPNCYEVVSAFHLNASPAAHKIYGVFFEFRICAFSGWPCDGVRRLGQPPAALPGGHFVIGPV
jgi:hypothetical protein